MKTMSPNSDRLQYEQSSCARSLARPLSIVEIRRPCASEFFLTFRPRIAPWGALEPPEELYRRVAECLAGIPGQIVQERCYATVAAFEEIRTSRERLYAEHGIDGHGAFCFVGQDPCESMAIAGVQLWVVGSQCAGGQKTVAPVVLDGKVVGRKFCCGDSCFISVPSVGPRDDVGETRSRKDRAVSMFEQANRILAANDLSFRDVARTWIYLPALLEWYGEFNAARRGAFREAGLLDGGKPVWLPASTGIQGACPEGRDCMMDFLALVRPDGSGSEMRSINSPDQCEAYQYGSSFARAVEIRDGALSRIYVSGTASIDEDGETIHVGDVEKQIRTTLRVVRDLLAPRGHSFGDIAQGVMFLKSPEFVDAHRRVAAEEGLDCRVVIEAVADVCRDDLLVELEIMTVKSLQFPGVDTAA